MKNLIYAGSTFTTTDEVASALLDFVVSQARTHPPEAVTVPVIIDGRASEITLVLTAGTPLAFAATDVHDMELDGSEYAARVLRHKTQRLDSIGII